MRTPEELNQLAIDIVMGHVFVTNTTQGIESAFMVVLAVMTPEDREKLMETKPFAFFEYLEKAGPRSINGYPSFFSLQIITEEEWEVLKPMIEKKKAALEQ